MPERVIPLLDLVITGMISFSLLITSFGIIPIIVAVLNGAYILSRLKMHIEKNHNGKVSSWLKYLVKKN